MDSIFAGPGNSSVESAHDPYSDDVRNLTVMFVQHADVKADYPAFQNGISTIAARNGIVMVSFNGENHANTYIAIGKGLKKAQLNGAHYEQIKALLAESDYARMQDIEKGYTAE